MTHSIQPKNLLAGLGLTWLILSSPIAVYVWRLLGVAPRANLAYLLLFVTITNGFSILLLSYLYYRFWVRLTQLKPGEAPSPFSPPPISDRQLTEWHDQNFVSAILDTANALIVVLDQQGRILRFNQTCERLTGYSFEEVKGKYIWDLFLVPEEIESVKTIIKELPACHFPHEQMLDNILTINRAETGQLDFQPTWVELEQFCQNVLAEVSRNREELYLFNFVKTGNCDYACLYKENL